MAGTQTEEIFQVNDKKQLMVLVRYKPANAIGADSMLNSTGSAVQGAVDKVEDAAAAIPGLNLFFKEEKEPEKQSDKEYTYFKDYSEWDSYFKKMKEELANKLNNENQAILFDFDAVDEKGREKEGKNLYNEIKNKISSWKDYTACFHFIGLGQGGNVVNECIRELCKEPDFRKKWWVQSVIYVGTPLYKNRHIFPREQALRGKGKIYAFGNTYDLTQNAIAYFEPNDKLLKMIAESNANLLSVFTGKIKAQLVATLGRLLSIEGFGTGHDNEENINKLTKCKDDVQSLVSECVEACKTVMNAFPGLIKPPDLPEFDKMLNGFDTVPQKSVGHLEKFIDELKKVRDGASLDTSRIGFGKLFNFLCPLVDQLTNTLKVFSFGSETTNQLADKVMQKAGIEKVLQPADIPAKTLPVDPYISKVVEMALEESKKEESKNENKGEDLANGTRIESAEEVWYDQANRMVSICKSNIADATGNGDLDLKDQAPEPEIKHKIGEVITAMLLPMMPSKKKFYAALLDYIPLKGMDGFLNKLTSDTAFGPLQGLISKLKTGFDFDEGTDEMPGLKKSLRNFDKELSRIKGFLDKNNYPLHKDANSLYFIYNSHNVMLRKPYGEILNTIDKETGYLDHMRSLGYTNFYNLEKNEYSGNGSQREDVQPATVLEKEEESA